MNICIYDNDCVSNVKLIEVFESLNYTNALWFCDFTCCENMLNAGLKVDLFIISWESEKNNSKKSVCDNLRSKGYTSPIIFTTENKNIGQKPQDLEDYLELKQSIYKYGIINVILKPYDIDKVYSKIQSAKKIIENRNKILQIQTSVVPELLK